MANQPRQSPRYYWAHHFVFYPLLAVLFIICLYELVVSNQPMLWLVLCGTLLLLCLLALMVRQHYALGNQDRIIRLELRLRYYMLTHRRFEEVERRLTKKQVFALRFASDTELESLVNRAVHERLSPVQIKQAIKDWVSDHDRL